MNYNELIKLRQKIINNYEDYYANLGFIKKSPLPLDSKDDLTLDFTTCTVCVAKPFIRKGEINIDYVMTQPAIRNTHLQDLGKIYIRSPYLSYFTMIGGFKYYRSSDKYEADFSKVIESEFNFLHQYFNNIILTIPKQYRKFLPISDITKEQLANQQCLIKYSTDDMENLKWKYGIRGVQGYGTRWEVVNGTVTNWGNTINVYRNGKPFGIDFGGGLETLICAYKGLPNAIHANDTFIDQIKDLCSSDIIYEKVLDCIVSSLCIINSKQEIVLRDEYILNQYLRLIVAYSIVSDIDNEEIIDVTNNIAFSSNSFLSNYDKITTSFCDRLLDTYTNFYKLVESEKVDEVVRLIDLCYNGNNNWTDCDKIIRSNVRKYFTNLSEVELLALRKQKNILKQEPKVLKRRNKK